MFSVIGIVVVMGAVLGGFTMAGGAMGVLVQPNELVVIGGAAVGTLIIAAPGKMRGRVLRTIKMAFAGGLPTKADYLDLLKLQFEVFTFVRKNGAIALEAHLAKIEKSEHLQEVSRASSSATTPSTSSATRCARWSTAPAPEDLAQLLDAELETHHEEAHLPIALLKTTGDALPGLGIVAAVLGIVITMGHLDGGAEEIGHHVAAALVGTFLGILLCYGVLQPLATNVEIQEVADTRYLTCLKEGLLASLRGASPAFAIEFARKAIFSDERPTSNETDEACRALKAAAPSA